MKYNPEIESYRYREPPFFSTTGKLCGAFLIPFRSANMWVISSGHEDKDWEHVSVSLKNRCPNWEEMCFVKELFWGDDVTVVQFHPKRSEYVNVMPHCLHLWKRVGTDFELPPIGMV